MRKVGIIDFASLVSSPSAPDEAMPVFGRQCQYRLKLVDSNLIEEAVSRKKLLLKCDRFSLMASIVVDQILARHPEIQKSRIGIFVGNALGGWSFGERELYNLHHVGYNRLSPYQATAWFPAAAQGEISIMHDIRGFSKTTSGGLLAGLEAMSIALDAITLKRIDYALVGSAESINTSFGLNGVRQLGIENDFLLGEGSAFLLLGSGGEIQTNNFVRLQQIHRDNCAQYRFIKDGQFVEKRKHEIFYLTLQPILEIIETLRQKSPCLLSFVSNNREFTMQLSLNENKERLSD